VLGIGYQDKLKIMKKPIFDEIDRRIIKENKSYYSSRMILFIATKKIEKAFIKSNIGVFLKKFVEFLDKKLEAWKKHL
jgi:hypothetical protein